MEAAVVSFGEISLVPSVLARRLDAGQVVELAESVVVVGLISALLVDSELRVVCGGHRFAALKMLSLVLEERLELMAEWFEAGVFAPVVEDDAVVMDAREVERRLGLLPETAFGMQFAEGMVPAVVVETLDALKDPARALELQISENEKRQDFSEEEIERIYHLLLASGRYYTGRGRDSQGREPINEALARLIGKSKSTVRRVVARIQQGANEEEEEERSDEWDYDDDDDEADDAAAQQRREKKLERLRTKVREQARRLCDQALELNIAIKVAEDEGALKSAAAQQQRGETAATVARHLDKEAVNFDYLRNLGA